MPLAINQQAFLHHSAAKQPTMPTTAHLIALSGQVIKPTLLIASHVLECALSQGYAVHYSATLSTHATKFLNHSVQQCQHASTTPRSSSMHAMTQPKHSTQAHIALRCKPTHSAHRYLSAATICWAPVTLPAAHAHTHAHSLLLNQCTSSTYCWPDGPPPPMPCLYHVPSTQELTLLTQRGTIIVTPLLYASAWTKLLWFGRMPSI